MTKPVLTTSFIYKGNMILVDWFELLNSPLPDLPWQQVHIVGDLDGKVPVVHYQADDQDSLPGGKTEPGESVDQTVCREIAEELNCTVLSWQPLGYQRLTEHDGHIIHQLRLYALLEKKGEFTHDPGGSVIGYSLVDIDNLNSYIKYGKVGARLEQLAKQVNGSSYQRDGGVK